MIDLKKNTKQCKQNVEQLREESDAAAEDVFKARLHDAESGRYYRPDSAHEFIVTAMQGVKIVKRRNKEYVYNCPAAFDIETTSFYREGPSGTEKAAIMYEWTFGLNGLVMIGRTWDEFESFCNELVTTLNLSDDKQLYIYVHNLGFEFGFIQYRFKWRRVFAISLRRPIYATTVNGLTFRCSQLLSGYNLEMVGKNLTKYKVAKKSGDLNYRLMRNSMTDLTADELQYCINDVLVVMAYIMERIETDGGILRIQLTKTGYVRKLVRDSCLYAGEAHNYKYNPQAPKQYQRYNTLMRHLQLTPDEYKQARRAFQGGFTHANGYAVEHEYYNVDSFDFTSSYPAVMVSEQFPMSKGELYDCKDYRDFKKQLDLYACMFDVEFTDLDASFPWEHYISSSRCVEIEDPVIDNGRVVSAARILTTLTELDFEIIEQTYTWRDMTIYNFRRYRRQYLPIEYVRVILDLYETKTQLKGLTSPDGTIERRYLAGKEQLNSLYGMTVMNICRPEIVFNGKEWTENPPDVDATIDKYNWSKTRFNSYLWGVWTTAFARYNLWTAILELGPDYLYSDTDSVKVVNTEQHKDYFEQYNKDIVNKLDAACVYHGIDPARTRPANSKGKIKQLGIWDHEETFKRFKTLGAKRYLTEGPEGVVMTVAGLSKKDAVKYLYKKYKDADGVFKAFCDDMEIPAEYMDNDDVISGTGKNTHTYIDYEYDGYMTDYQGHKAYYSELSGIHLEAAGYSLSLAEAYVRYLFGIKDVIGP